MVLSIYGLFISITLFVNALSVLDEGRFLRKCLCIPTFYFVNKTSLRITKHLFPINKDGFGYKQSKMGESDLKDKIIPILDACRVLRCKN